MKYVMTLTAVLTIGTAQGVLSSGCSDDSGLSQETRYVGVTSKQNNDVFFVDFSGKTSHIGAIPGCSADVVCGIGSSSAWSPDGRKIRIVGDVSCALDIETRQCEPVDPHFFSWSQDSDHALFYDSDSHMLYRGKLDGSEREDLEDICEPTIVAPDESLALCWQCDGVDGECLVNLQTGETKSYPCTADPQTIVWTPYWFADSRTVLVVDNYPGYRPNGAIWLCDVETGEIKTLVDEDYEHGPALDSERFPVSPDERYLAFIDTYKLTTGFTVVDMQSEEKWFVELDQARLLTHGYTYDSLYMLVGQGDDLFGYDLQERKLTKLPIQDMYPRMSPIEMTLPKW